MSNTDNQECRLNQKEPHIFTLIVMSSFASMGAVVFTPALPEISNFFKISHGHSQLTITLFLVGYALGQLVYGPFSNFFGRKKAFFIGVFIATIGSIVSIISEPIQSFNLLILGRMLEALGSSAGLVISFTIVNDHYFPGQARKIISYMMLAFAVVPGLATFIGGLLVTKYHWISCFYFLLLYGLFISLFVYKLAETAIYLDKSSLKVSQIKSNYSISFKNSLLRNASLFLGLSGMCVYTYAATTPFIAIDNFHMSPGKFGTIGLIPFLGTGFGAIFSAKLSHKFSPKELIKIGYIIEIISTSIIVTLFYFELVSMLFLILFGFIFMFGGCLVISNSASIATSTVSNKANASAVMNFINVGMAVCGTFILSILPGSPQFRLCLVLILAMIFMGFLWKNIDFKTEEKND